MIEIISDQEIAAIRRERRRLRQSADFDVVDLRHLLAVDAQHRKRTVAVVEIGRLVVGAGQNDGGRHVAPRADGKPLRAVADHHAIDKLRLIARRLVDKAAEGDIQAIKEVLDRIDGKSVPAPGDAERGPRQVSIRWKSPIPSSTASPAGNSPPSMSGRKASPPS